MTAKKKTDEKQKRGRKSIYKEEYCNQVLKLCLLGATDKDLSEFFGVSEKTLNSWKKNYPEFLQSIKKGKNIADANVASKLYNRAIGYDYKEITRSPIKDKDGIAHMAEVKTVNKHVPADTTAAIFWLKNRQPEKWRDRKELDANVNLGDELESMTKEQLEAIIRGEKE